MNRAFFILSSVLCAFVLLSCTRSTNTNVAVQFTPPEGLQPRVVGE